MAFPGCVSNINDGGNDGEELDRAWTRARTQVSRLRKGLRVIGKNSMDRMETRGAGTCRGTKLLRTKKSHSTG